MRRLLLAALGAATTVPVMAKDASTAFSNVDQHHGGGVAFFFGLLVAFIARSKGRSFFGWFLLGLLFNIFALIAVCSMSSKKQLEISKPPEDRTDPSM